MTWTHKYVTAPRRLPESAGYGKRADITATAGLHHLGGNLRPYFSVTATIANRYITRGDPVVAAGAMHKEIGRRFPKLRPVIALHLSDDTGAPMYALKNGAYWLGLSPWQAFDAGHVARHFRITEQEALDLRDSIGGSEAHLAEWVDAQAPRWQAEADAAVALLDELIAEASK